MRIFFGLILVIGTIIAIYIGARDGFTPATGILSVCGAVLGIMCLFGGRRSREADDFDEEDEEEKDNNY